MSPAAGQGTVITEEEKARALGSMPVPRLAWDAVQEYTMSTTERLKEQLVIRERMMQERALLPKFAVEEYFLQIFGKNLKEVLKILYVTWLPLVPLIVFDNKLITVTMNEVLMSATSIPDMRMYILLAEGGSLCVYIVIWTMCHKETKNK